MAHFVGKTLHIRPNEILDTWGVPELLVAYGEYMNELSERNYMEWQSAPADTKRKVQRPDKVAVPFFTMDDLEEE